MGQVEARLGERVAALEAALLAQTERRLDERFSALEDALLSAVRGADGGAPRPGPPATPNAASGGHPRRPSSAAHRQSRGPPHNDQHTSDASDTSCV